MKISKLLFTGLLVVLLAGMTGCGGGGGGTNAPATSVTTAVTINPPTATIKLAVNNVPAGSKVGALLVDLQLPVGVTPSSIINVTDASGSVAVSAGVSGLAVASYNSVTRVISSSIISGSGFSSGEYITITCTIAPGTTVTPANFPAQATITQIILQ